MSRAGVWVGIATSYEVMQGDVKSWVRVSHGEQRRTIGAEPIPHRGLPSETAMVYDLPTSAALLVFRLPNREAALRAWVCFGEALQQVEFHGFCLNAVVRVVQRQKFDVIAVAVLFVKFFKAF